MIGRPTWGGGCRGHPEALALRGPRHDQSSRETTCGLISAMSASFFAF